MGYYRDMREDAAITERYERMATHLNERTRRLMAASEALVMGWGGISRVSRSTGLSRATISHGIKELRGEAGPTPTHIRRSGGGRKKTVTTDPSLQTDLERLIDPLTRGDPESPLRWTCKSQRKLATELRALGHTTSSRMVAVLLRELGYRLHANRKTQEGGTHPDRNAQFAHINATAQQFVAAGQPAISVDAKKKELVGNLKNPGQEWEPEGYHQEVKVYDFPDPHLGRVTPYGVYDLHHNRGWVNVGIDHDTALFAVESIRRWWQGAGQLQYPTAQELLITADGGGSNGSRNRLWKVALQHLADETNLAITVCHFPPGTSKWNKIEHRLFAWISQNWRATPLVSYAVIIERIAATTTTEGLTVECQLDTHLYPTGRKVSDEEIADVCLQGEAFHGEWNYTIRPHSSG